MKLADEAALRRQLHDEIDLPAVRPVPVQAVFRRYRAVRARRLSAIASGVALIAVAVGVLVTHAPAGLRGASPGHSDPLSPPGGVFASGTANGRQWQLAAVNLANPGYRCLPGVVLNGQSGDLLQPSYLPGFALGDAAFLAVDPGRPWIGYAFLQLRPGVREVTANLGDKTRLSVRPVTVTVCGQRFRLAGFEYPRQGVTRIVARSAGGRAIDYRPLADYFNPSSPFQAGTWLNFPAATGNAASGEVGSGSVGGTSWRMRVTLGPDGECFTAQAAQVGLAGLAGPGAAASICRTVSPAPKGALLTPLPYAMPADTLVWYPGTVNVRTAYLRVQLSNGKTSRLVPMVVGGRKYIAVGVEGRVKLVRLILYDTHGHILADVASQACCR